MAINTLNAVQSSITLPDFLAEKIQRANYSLTDLMYKVLARYRGAEAIFGVSREHIETFNEHIGPKLTLMSMPFLALSPTLPNPRDWETFVDGIMFSPTVAKLTSMMPEVDGMIGRDIFHYNCMYVTLLKVVLNMNVLAAPLLGISFELANYLTRLPMRQIETAVAAIKFPLFRWRFDDPIFWTEYVSNWLSREAVAHYLMRTSGLPASALPFRHSWSDLRLQRSEREAYASILMSQGSRAAIAVDFFHITKPTSRDLYRKIHGVSSPCGSRPRSLIWYVQDAAHRVQATFMTWLYRCALKNDANIPEALIAANDIALKMFGHDLLIPSDRLNHLTGAMASDSRLTMSACRSCGTEYILSNGEGKIELAKDFVCPGCKIGLKLRSGTSKKKPKKSEA